MQSLHVQLLFRLDPNRVSAGPLCSLSNSKRVIPIILLSFSERAHSFWRQEFDVMAERDQLMCQPVGP